MQRSTWESFTWGQRVSCDAVSDTRHSPRYPRHSALLPRVPGQGVGYPAPAHTRAEESSGAGGRPAVLAGPASRPPRWRPVTQHLGVLLLVLAQHLRHSDQGLNLRHFLADVHQLGQVRLTDVMNRCQVSSRITLWALNSKFASLKCR